MYIRDHGFSDAPFLLEEQPITSRPVRRGSYYPAQGQRVFRSGRTYTRTHEALRQVPLSYRYDSSRNGVGEPSRTPVLLTHYYVRKYFDPSSRALLSDPGASVMTAAQMRPGFVGVTDPRRVSLQNELTKLIQDKYSAAVSPKVQLRIALADLTNAKQHTPTFAGFRAFNATKPEAGATIEGGSLVKILALYALYQLRFDVNTFAALNAIAKGRTLQEAIAKEWKKAGLKSPPNLTGLFQFVENTGRPVEARLRRTPAIHENSDARILIVALGFEYIGSVALQSGLFDEKQGGLWLNAAYEEPALTWWGSPFPTVPRHSVTALSAATFFTLLAQGRLVNQASSIEIANVLKRQCARFDLLDGVKQLPGAPAASPNKCGILLEEIDKRGRLVHGRYFHEAIHMIRQPAAGKRLEYVAAVLSEKPPKIDFMELGKDLDSIIEKQNP